MQPVVVAQSLMQASNEETVEELRSPPLGSDGALDYGGEGGGKGGLLTHSRRRIRC